MLIARTELPIIAEYVHFQKFAIFFTEIMIFTQKLGKGDSAS